MGSSIPALRRSTSSRGTHQTAPRRGRDLSHGGNEAETGDGPSRSPKEHAGTSFACPLEGGGDLVEMTPDEVRALGAAIDNCEGLA